MKGDSTAIASAKPLLTSQGFGGVKPSNVCPSTMLGGMSIAYSQVGACHALSYGLSYVLGTHHGVGCCITFDTLDEYYGEGVREFRTMMEKTGVDIPRGLTRDLTDDQMETMITVALGLDPLWENCLGKDWKTIMTRDKARSLFMKM